MPLPTSAFVAAKSVFGGKSYVSFTPTGGSELKFEFEYLDLSLDQSLVELKIPDGAGIKRVVRQVVAEQSEYIVGEINEAKRITTDLFSGAMGGRRTGVARFYISEVDDASGKICWLSEDAIPVTVTRESGAMKVGGGDFSKPPIRFTSNKAGAIAWTTNADIPA
jgi:hypothetical protein